MGPYWIVFLLFLASCSVCPSAARPDASQLREKRFLPGADKETQGQIDQIIADLKEKFGEVEPGFFDKLKENIKNIPGTIKDKVDNIISGIFDLFGGKKSDKHEISPEEKAFRQKFNKVLEELKKTVPVKDRKRFLPGADKETKAKIDAVIAELKKKFGEVGPGFFEKLKESIKSIPGTIKDKIDNMITGIFDLFGKGKTEHVISPEEKAFREKFNKILEELKKKVPVIEKRFLPGADKETMATINQVIADLKEKFGEVDPGFFENLKENIKSIPGTIKDKVDSIISGIFDLFGGNKSEEHELSPEEKAFRKKFNKVLEELKTTVPVKDRKRFLPGADKETKAKIDAVIAELKKKFGEVGPGFFERLKENIKSIPGTIKDKVDSMITSIFDLFGKGKTEHVISPEEKAFREKFSKILEELKKKVPVKDKRFLPGADKETKADIDKVIAGLKEKFGEVEPGFFDKLKENIKNIPGSIKDKVDSIVNGIFNLFGKGKGEHAISPEEEAFRKQFNKVLEELKSRHQ